MTAVTGYEVTEGGYGDIIEWTNGEYDEEDGYTTLVQVVKADDQDAELVYIYMFNADFYLYHDVEINVNGQNVATLYDWFIFDSVPMTEYLQPYVEAGYDTYTYYINDVQVDSGEDLVLDEIRVPFTNEDVVIDVVITDDDLLTSVTLANNGDITFNDNADTDKTYSAELYKRAEGSGIYTVIWEGEYKYGDANLDIPRGWVDEAGSYYVVIGGVTSNVVLVEA